MIGEGHTTGGAVKNAKFLGDAFVAEDLDEATRHLIFDPQTSGGLALFSQSIIDAPCIGRVVSGPAKIIVR